MIKTYSEFDKIKKLMGYYFVDIRLRDLSPDTPYAEVKISVCNLFVCCVPGTPQCVLDQP